MPKKIKLEDIKIQSFITHLNKDEKSRLKGKDTTIPGDPTGGDQSSGASGLESPECDSRFNTVCPWIEMD